MADKKIPSTTRWQAAEQSGTPNVIEKERGEIQDSTEEMALLTVTEQTTRQWVPLSMMDHEMSLTRSEVR